MKNGKRHLTSRMDQPNKDKIERSENIKPINTRASLKMTQSNKLR